MLSPEVEHLNAHHSLSKDIQGTDRLMIQLKISNTIKKLEFRLHFKYIQVLLLQLLSGIFNYNSIQATEHMRYCLIVDVLNF